ncbi:MAG: hypothetical protein ACKO2A_13480, partial [Acidimicrobiaceae bacterium]
MSTTKAKSTRKFFALILATALIAGACSSNQSTNSDDTSDEIATPTDDSTTDLKASEKVTLKLLAYD